MFAYRGATFEKLDLFKTNSLLKAYFKSVLGGQIVVQQAPAYEATGEMTKYAEGNNYNLSFTGHSLGAWLAEFSLYFAHRDFHYPKAKAITFDSQGFTTKSLQPQMHSHETTFDVKNLNITTYLSATNFVNVCNSHINKSYRLFPKITPKHTGKIINILNKTPIIKNYTPLLDGVLSLSSYLLNPILDSFDPKTGKPIKYEQILDWPRIEYNPKDNTLINKALDFIPLASNLIYKNATVTTFGSFFRGNRSAYNR
ncbi:alpha/beta hydrolase family protein [Rickettsia australis]|uniref:DUF2974 domain-containing protein n=1 Tax=Rickettsia australis TaxID=787 RepID=UPI00031E13D9|nr:DUF2974 domain-containing protein [Rickettsia australis]